MRRLPLAASVASLLLLLGLPLAGCPGVLTIAGYGGDDDSASGDDDVSDDDDDGGPLDSDGDGSPDSEDCAPQDPGLDVEDWDGDGVTSCDGDCDDDDADVLPGADEHCDGIDNDCDGRLDPGPIFFVKPHHAGSAERWDWNGAGFDDPVPMDPPGDGIVWSAVGGDFDGDGMQDIILERGAQDGSLGFLYRGLCGGGFEDAEQLGQGSGFPIPGLTDIHGAADLDGDGDLDVVGWDWGDGRGRVWLNDGDGTGWTMLGGNSAGGGLPFQLELWDAYDDSIRESVAVTPFDVNDDGLPDLIECGNNASAPTYCIVHAGLGDGRFEFLTDYEVDRLVNGFAVGDFDLDGSADMVGGLDDDGDAGQAWAWFGNPDDLQPPEGQGVEAFDVNAGGQGNDSDAPGYGWMAPYDFDGDGAPEIVVSVQDPFTSEQRRLWLAWNDGGGDFELHQLGLSGGQWGADYPLVPETIAVPAWP
jgi:hypothetical protein